MTRPLADGEASADTRLAWTLEISKEEGESSAANGATRRQLGLNLSTRVTAQGSAGLLVTGVQSDGLLASWNAKRSEPYIVCVGDEIESVNGVCDNSQAMIKEFRSATELCIKISRPKAKAAAAPELTPAAGSEERSPAAEPQDVEEEEVSKDEGCELSERTEEPARSSADEKLEPCEDFLAQPSDGAVANANGYNHYFRVELERAVNGGESLGISVVCNPTCSRLLVNAVLDTGVVAQWNLRAPEEQRIACGDTIVEVNGVSNDLSKMLEEMKAEGKSILALHRVISRPLAPAQIAMQLQSLSDGELAGLVCALCHGNPELRAAVLGA